MISTPSCSSASRAILVFMASMAAARVSATTHVVDPIAALIREYSREGTSAEYMRRNSDEDYARYVLTRPDFPYADEVVRALPDPDAPTKRVVEAASTRESPINVRDLHNMKVWDLGFTKARLWREVHWLPDELRNIPGAPGAVKAGIEPDIYAKAYHLVGRQYPAIAANYAVAAQLLRAKLASTPRARWKELGLRPDVIDRFVHADGASGLSDFDLHYLVQFLDGALATWDVGYSSAYGLRELPAIFRVGRLAGAYRDRNPYDREPCLTSGRYDQAHAGRGGVDRRPLCFADATDRAVHRWYVSALRDELAAIQPVLRSKDAAERMAVPLRSSRQGWIGIRRSGALEIASRKEVVEAKVADKLLAAGNLSYRDAFEAGQRALRLTCDREL